MPALSRLHLTALQDLASRVLEKRALGADNETLANDLLFGFHEVCMLAGLDGVLAELEQAFAPLSITDGSSLSEEPRLRAALVGNLATFVQGGPRNAKPRLLAEALVTSLDLTLTDELATTASFGDELRVELMAALASVIDVELGVPQVRTAIIAKGRQLCDARFHAAFDKLAAQLDERGMRLIKELKLPIDAVQGVKQALFDAREAVIGKATSAAIDRAKAVLAKVDAELAARIDRPITLRLTPRDVAIRRANDARVPKVPARVVQSLFDSLTELLHVVWRVVEKTAKPYAASQTFAVGDVIEHPKFGRGSVLSSATQRIEVEFAEATHTLVHGRGK